MNADTIAFNMFARNAAEYAEEDMVLTVWATEPEVREFWLKQARAVAADLGVTLVEEAA